MVKVCVISLIIINNQLLIYFQHAVSPRCRVRKQVGDTNRWRLPDSLGSDLLGSRQAIRSINMPYNNNMINIITGTNNYQGTQQHQHFNNFCYCQILGTCIFFLKLHLNDSYFFKFSIFIMNWFFDENNSQIGHIFCK